jgi:serine/threonine protein kinase
VKYVKIIDFGFANFLTNIQNKEGEALCGTTNYIAPESL